MQSAVPGSCLYVGGGRVGRPMCCPDEALCAGGGRAVQALTPA